MNRLFLITFFLCMTIFSFANKRKIVLEERARLPMPRIEAFIDEDSKELTLDIGEYLSTVKVLVTDLSGNAICSEEINMGGISILELPVVGEGKYILFLFVENIELRGFLDIG